jgi:hypothetical protein
MKIASRKDIIWLSAVSLIILGAGYAREVLIQKNTEFACGMDTTIFPSPSPATIPYDVVFYEQVCGMEGSTFTEIRLKSKSPPYKQKSVFRYDPRKDEDDAARIPKIHWLSPHDLEISLGYIDEIDYRYNKIRDINIHYNMKTGWSEESKGAGGTDPWEWLGMGWRVTPDNDNAVYADKPAK